jgi:glycosyltransferase involved in cell wall biosynthesis
MRVALLSCTARVGDAIGNQVAEKLSVFLERGADVRVFLESLEQLHPRIGAHAQLMTAEPDGAGWEFLRSADLVSVEFGQYYCLLGLLPLLTSNRIVIDYHGITPPPLWGRHNGEALEKGLSHRGLVWCADLTLVHSRCMERELIATTGIAAERICHIGLPVDPEQFSPFECSSFQPSDTQAPRRARKPGPTPSLRGLEPGLAKLLLYVGRLATNKRVPLLVKVLALLNDVRPPTHLLIAGDTSDVYGFEAERCRARARELGVAERLHFLGHLTGEALRHAYQSADVLVIPSAWESFSVPVIEAMACGVPVVAARAFALPETVGDAGLTFRVDDPADCARQVRRVLDVAADFPSADRPQRIAIVSFRYGNDFAGGAEWSLRRIAASLSRAGHHVEIFTTCNSAESTWRNELPRGTTRDGELLVHRFPIDRHDRRLHLETYRAIVQANGRVSPQVEEDYLAHSVHSSALLESLARREHELDAIITGPYLFGLTCAVARRFPEKTLLLPCLHDEALARLAIWPTVYSAVAGVLYHSAEEQEFAQTELGVNHPRSTVVGTWLDVGESVPVVPEGNTSGVFGRYLLYCGRYSEQKEVPQLLDFARRYNERHPARFTFAFIGQGEIEIPKEAWARDLGFVAEDKKRRLLAGADALIQLSRKESLSLVALEAWSLGTPVIAHRGCAVLAGHLGRSQAGATVSAFETFARSLDDLWANPHDWQARGRRGRDYVRSNYGSYEAYVHRLEGALAAMKQPLGVHMRCRGLERAKHFHRSAWRERFGNLIATLLHAEPRTARDEVAIQPRCAEHRARLGTSSLLSVRVINNGTMLHVSDGPGRTRLACRVFDASRSEWLGPRQTASLPGVLPPGTSLPAALPVAIPPAPGRYEIHLYLDRPGLSDDNPRSSAQVSLLVEEGVNAAAEVCRAPFLESVREALAEAQRLEYLPDDYVDVTQGWFARAKRWIKRKLLNNFKLAYVDVLSRQQTQVNRKLVTAVQELVEWCGTLDHALRLLQERIAKSEARGVPVKEHSQFPSTEPASARTAPAESLATDTGEAAPAR